MKKKLLAVILTATLVASSSVVAYADAPITEAVVVDGETDDPVVVNSDVTVSEDSGADYAVNATKGAEVTVNGSVTLEGNKGEGVYASGDSKVNVTGDVTGPDIGVCAEGSSEITVEGTINNGVVVTDSTVIAGGINGASEYTKVAISESGGSFVQVNGDVTSDKGAILTDGDSTIIIDGTVTSSSTDPVILLDHTTYDEDTYAPLPNMDAEASTIIVYQIKGNLDNLVSSGYKNDSWEFVEDTDATLKNSQLDNIFYIIKKAADSAANILNLGGTEKKEGYDVATEGTSVVVSVKEGYGVTAGSIKVTKNSDGTFTLIVPKGGGVTISAEALQDAIDEAGEKGQAEVPAEKTSSSVTSSEPAAPAAPASSVIPGTTGSNTALSPVALGDGAYVTMFTTLVNNTPYGGTVEITVSDEAYLNDVIVASLATRRDVSVKINVMVGGELYVINIPAGYDLTSLIGPDGKISIAALIQLFGTKTNI